MKKEKNLYLTRYAYPPVILEEVQPKNPGIIVTIPAYHEPDLLNSLQSLAGCDLPQCDVMVIVLINQPENCGGVSNEINRKSYEKAVAWSSGINSSRLYFKILWLKDLPAKDAGVGLARKIAMDEAVRQFEKLRSVNPSIHEDGIIVGYDADCTCDNNYLLEIERYFTNKHIPAANIYYEHPLEGVLKPVYYEAILQYELYLRYHVHALRYTGFPYAFQTVGSCMAVRSSVYQKQGGMNKRKAGEDFYFLQKLFPLKGFGEITRTCVKPSPRISDRVPFGTGKAMGVLLENESPKLLVYDPRSYRDLREFINNWQEYYHTTHYKMLIQKLPESIKTYLQKNDFEKVLEEIKSSSPQIETFYKKFFHWMNGFRIFKYMNDIRDHFYPSIEVEKAAEWLLKEQYNWSGKTDTKSLLLELRKIDKGLI